MSNLSRGGIAYDLNTSPYREVIEYEDHKIEYVFSSARYRLNFLSKLGEHRKSIHHSLSKRFGFEIKNDKLCDLVLYTKIEKRGFLVINNGVKISCLNNIKLDGISMMNKN